MDPKFSHQPAEPQGQSSSGRYDAMGLVCLTRDQTFKYSTARRDLTLRAVNGGEAFLTRTSACEVHTKSKVGKSGIKARSHHLARFCRLLGSRRDPSCFLAPFPHLIFHRVSQWDVMQMLSNGSVEQSGVAGHSHNPLKTNPTLHLPLIPERPRHFFHILPKTESPILVSK